MNDFFLFSIPSKINKYQNEQGAYHAMSENSQTVSTHRRLEQGIIEFMRRYLGFVQQ